MRCPQGTHTRQQRRWQVYCLGYSSRSCLGNFPESRETHLRCIRCRPRGLSRTFYLPYDVGAHQGIPPSEAGSFYSYWRISRIDITSIQHQTDAGILTLKVVVISYDPNVPTWFAYQLVSLTSEACRALSIMGIPVFYLLSTHPL